MQQSQRACIQVCCDCIGVFTLGIFPEPNWVSPAKWCTFTCKVQVQVAPAKEILAISEVISLSKQSFNFINLYLPYVNLQEKYYRCKKQHQKDKFLISQSLECISLWNVYSTNSPWFIAHKLLIKYWKNMGKNERVIKWEQK